jgi:hypothetical protein
MTAHLPLPTILLAQAGPAVVPRPSGKRPSKIIFTQIDRFLGVCVYLTMDECVGVVREFSKEEVVMSETRRMAEEAKSFGEEVQEQTQKMGREYQRTVESGFETASKSFSEANKGFQALAAEMMEYSKAAFDDAMRTWGQLICVRSLDQAVQIQSDYAKRAYDNHMAELSKVGEMCLSTMRDASKTVEDASRRFR